MNRILGSPLALLATVHFTLWTLTSEADQTRGAVTPGAGRLGSKSTERWPEPVLPKVWATHWHHQGQVDAPQKCWLSGPIPICVEQTGDGPGLRVRSSLGDAKAAAVERAFQSRVIN